MNGLFQTPSNPATKRYALSASGWIQRLLMMATSDSSDRSLNCHEGQLKSPYQNPCELQQYFSPLRFLPVPLYSALLISYGLDCLLSRICTLTHTLSCPFSALRKFTSCLKTNSPAHCMKLHFKRVGQGHYFTMSEVYIRDYLLCYTMHVRHAMSPTNNMKGALMNISFVSNNCTVKGSIIMKM